MSGGQSRLPAARLLRTVVFTSLRGYRPEWLRGDCVAGLTVWAVLVPEALAYAGIAGVSPVTGLYAAPGALVLYAAFGSSKHLIAGPMAATAALSAAAVGTLAAGNSGRFTSLTAALAVTVGVIAVVAALARLGFVASLISGPVLKGFIIGLALTIIIGQVPKLFGVSKGSGDFFGQLWDVLTGLGRTQWPTLAVGAASLAVVLVLRRGAPAVPAPLVAVIGGILAVHLLGLQRHGVKIVGHIDSGLPSFGFPGIGGAGYLKLAGPAVGVMLVGFAEGLGAANLAAGLSGGMVVNGSLSKTAVNGSAGARTQVSGLVTAVLVVLTLLFLTGLFQDLPEATLGAVVIAALLQLLDISGLRALYAVRTARLGRIYGLAARADFIAAVAAMAGVLVFDTLPGLVIGIGISMLLLLYRAGRPNIAVLGRVPGTGQWADRSNHPENTASPGVTVLRVESGLFFANADYVREAVRSAASGSAVRAVILDCQTVPFIDETAATTLDELTESLRREGVRLAVARDVGQVRDMLTGPHVPQQFRSVREAVAAVQPAAGRPAGLTEKGE